MAFQIDKRFVVRAAPGAVWDFLTDPRRVVRCMPGASITEQVDERTYTGAITVKVGPVSASYKGKLHFESLDAASRSAELVASGQETRGKGGATMRLTSRLVERVPGETEVATRSEVNVTGMLAQMGRGMIQDVSDQMFVRFTDAMRAELEGAVAAPGAATVTPPAPSPAALGVQEAPAAAAAAAPAGTAPAELDVLALGLGAAGRALGRTVREPAFWVGVAATTVGFLVFRLLSRRSH